MDKKWRLKIAVVGSKGCGKTELLRSVCPEFAQGPTRVPQSEALQLVSGGTLEVWDSSGEGRLFAAGSPLLRHPSICMLVFDVSSRDSFSDLSVWLSRCVSLLDLSKDSKNESKPLLVLVGTKCDLSLERVVDSQHAIEWCKANGILHYFETASPCPVFSHKSNSVRWREKTMEIFCSSASAVLSQPQKYRVFTQQPRLTGDHRVAPTPITVDTMLLKKKETGLDAAALSCVGVSRKVKRKGSTDDSEETCNIQ